MERREKNWEQDAREDMRGDGEETERGTGSRKWGSVREAMEKSPSHGAIG